MQTVILARSVDEGRKHARQAGLRPGEYVVAGSASGIRGIHLADDDLIAEFPGFRDRSDHEQIIWELSRSMKQGGVPHWEKLGSP